jgi:predicted transcriptional regulator
MTQITITESDILEALAASVAGNDPKGAKTTREIAADSGLRENRVRNALHVFQSQGRLQVHQVMRPSLDGKLKPCAAYTVLPKAKAKK